jgi:hypothetical protein
MTVLQLWSCSLLPTPHGGEALPWLPFKQLPGRAGQAAWGIMLAVLHLHANQTRRQVGSRGGELS